MIARLIVRTLLVNRHDDGSAGDANYGRIGQGYTAYRKPDPAIASFIEKAFGDVDTTFLIHNSFHPRKTVQEQRLPCN